MKTVFEVSRNIFKKNYGEIEDVYRNQEINSELGLVIGAITESKELMNHALKRKGGDMNMCKALEELKKEGLQEGKIIGYIAASKGFGVEEKVAENKIRETYGLNEEEAAAYMEKYWQ